MADGDAVATQALESAGERPREVPAGVQIELLGVKGAAARAAGDGLAQYQYTVQVIRLAEELRDPNYLVRSLNTLAVTLGDAGCPRPTSPSSTRL